jgi:hypothetical protein
LGSFQRYIYLQKLKGNVFPLDISITKGVNG